MRVASARDAAADAAADVAAAGRVAGEVRRAVRVEAVGASVAVVVDGVRAVHLRGGPRARAAEARRIARAVGVRAVGQSVAVVVAQVAADVDRRAASDARGRAVAVRIEAVDQPVAVFVGAAAAHRLEVHARAADRVRCARRVATVDGAVAVVVDAVPAKLGRAGEDAIVPVVAVRAAAEVGLEEVAVEVHARDDARRRRLVAARATRVDGARSRAALTEAIDAARLDAVAEEAVVARGAARRTADAHTAVVRIAEAADAEARIWEKLAGPRRLDAAIDRARDSVVARLGREVRDAHSLDAAPLRAVAAQAIVALGVARAAHRRVAAQICARV